MCWGSSDEGVEMCRDNPYKSSLYQNLIVIFINVLMIVKWQCLSYLYALNNKGYYYLDKGRQRTLDNNPKSGLSTVWGFG
jgi:hypothetical protein